MKPGRELDVLVAERVMGLKTGKYVWGKRKQYSAYFVGDAANWDDDGSGASVLFNELPHYSTDLASAWEVVKTLSEAGWIVKMITSEMGGTDCTLVCGVGARGRIDSDCMGGIITTAPHAICLAALKAVGCSKT